MPRQDFQHVRAWVFDLDNTLYPADCHLFAQIDARMTSFIEAELGHDRDTARRLQKEYYARFGTTLSGLMSENGVRPNDFLDYVHDIDLTPVEKNLDLAKAIKALPGKRYIFTNGSLKHAENVASAIGILDLFDGLFDIQRAAFTPKPHRAAYDLFHQRFDIDPCTGAMFEDMPHNLCVPFEVGMRTVLVQSDAEWFADEPEDKRPARPGEIFDHVHHVTQDLTRFLCALTERTPPTP